MNESEVARLEEQLKLELPRRFVDIVRQLAQEVEGLQGMHRKGVRCPLIYSGSYLLSVNEMVRRRPMLKDWPNWYLVCGYDCRGASVNTYLIDTRRASHKVWQLDDKSTKPEPCSEYPNLDSLHEYALRTFREYDAKETRRRGKAKPSTIAPVKQSKKLTRKTESPTSAKRVEKKSMKAQTPDPQLVSAMKKALGEAGFDLIKPERKHPIEVILGDVLPALPSELLALYTLCDGGTSERLSLRILPLAEAADLAKTYYLRAWPTSGLFGVMQMESSSIECAVSLHGPLEGYVVAVHEGQFKTILARSLMEVLGILASNLEVEGWDLETVLFGNPPEGHMPFVFEGDVRQADDIRRARELQQLAKAQSQAHEGDEYRSLFEMTWKLYSTAEVGEVIPMLKHEDSQVANDACVYLSGIRTPKVGRALEAIYPGLADYIQELVAVLCKAKFDAHVVHGVWIRLDPGRVWIGPANSRFETRDKREHWDNTIRWVKYLLESQQR